MAFWSDLCALQETMEIMSGHDEPPQKPRTRNTNHSMSSRPNQQYNNNCNPCGGGNSISSRPPTPRHSRQNNSRWQPAEPKPSYPIRPSTPNKYQYSHRENSATRANINCCDPCKLEPIDCNNVDGSARMRRMEDSMKRKEKEILSLKQELRERDFALENVRNVIEEFQVKLDSVDRLEKERQRLQRRFTETHERLTRTLRELDGTKTALYSAEQHINQLENNMLHLDNECRRHQREKETEVSAGKQASQREIACLREEYQAVIRELERELQCKDQATRQISDKLSNMKQQISDCTAPCKDGKKSKDGGKKPGMYKDIWEPDKPKK